MPKIDKSTFLFLWLFNPFASSIYLFKNFKYNKSIYPYLLLSFFFGLSFVVSTTGGDSQRYAIELMAFNQQNLSFGELLKSLYTDSGTRIDVYQPLVTWFVSCFTSNVKVLFSIYATVFGYFWFKSLIIVRSQISIPFKKITFFIFVLLALTNPIWNINGVRMWTAVNIFFYGILLIHIQKRKGGWFYLISPIFVHFSLVLPLGLYVLYRFLPFRNINIIFGIYLITFFLGELNLDVLKNYLLLLPDFIHSKEGYLQEEYVNKIEGSREFKSLFYSLAQTFSKYLGFILSCIAYYYLMRKRQSETVFLSNFFIMALMFLSFSNIMSSVPSGGRFSVLSFLILFTFFLLLLNCKTSIPSGLKIILGSLLLFVIIFKLRVGMEFMGGFLFIGNPLVNWFVVDIPIIEIIKNIL